MAMNILTSQQLHKTAPAIFADAPAHEVSVDMFVSPTIDVVNALQEEGWYPVRVQQTKTRDPSKQLLARHMVRFRQDPDRQIKVGDSISELVLTNSHDRSAAYQLDLGLFRLVCSNGMVTPAGDLGGIRVKHGKTLWKISLKVLYHSPMKFRIYRIQLSRSNQRWSLKRNLCCLQEHP